MSDEPMLMGTATVKGKSERVAIQATFHGLVLVQFRDRQMTLSGNRLIRQWAWVPSVLVRVDEAVIAA